MKPEVGGEGLPVAKPTGVDSNTSAAPLTQQSSIDAVVELYSPDFTHVYSVPKSGIYQMPPARMHITRFCACKNFSNAVVKAVESGNPEMGTEAWYKTACPLDTFCRFVHVARPLSEFPRQAIHVHYIWRSLKEVTYEALEPTLNTGDEPPSSPRLKLVLCHDYRNQILKMREQCSGEEASSPKVYVRDGDVDFHARTEPGAAFMVGVMAAVLPSVRVPATRLLKTAGAVECLRRLQAGESVPELALCLAHLVENECRKGCECPYAHAINLDSNLKVPFVRRTLRQIKKAALSMELVDAEGAYSTTAMSAGTSRGSTPSFLPQDTITRFCSRRNSELLDQMDQLSLSFNSAISNSASEFSTATRDAATKHHHNHRQEVTPSFGVVGSDVDDLMHISEPGSPTSTSVMPYHVFSGGPPTPALTPTTRPNPVAVMPRHHEDVKEEVDVGPPSYDTSNHSYHHNGEFGGVFRRDSQSSLSTTQFQQLPPPPHDDPRYQQYQHESQQMVGAARNLGNPTSLAYNQNHNNITGPSIHAQQHRHHHHRRLTPRGNSYHQASPPSLPPPHAWGIHSSGLPSRDEGSIPSGGRAYHHHQSAPVHSLHHTRYSYHNPHHSQHHHYDGHSSSSHSGGSPDSSGTHPYSSSASIYNRNRW